MYNKQEVIKIDVEKLTSQLNDTKLLVELVKSKTFLEDLNEAHDKTFTMDPNNAIFKEGQRSILSHISYLANRTEDIQAELNKDIIPEEEHYE